MVNKKLCINGVHELVKKFLVDEIMLPWDEGNNMLQEILIEVGILRGYIKENHGVIEFSKTLPEIEMYQTLVKQFETLYDEKICSIEITKIE